MLSQPGLKQKFEGIWVYPHLLSPSETTAFILKEQDLWRDVVRQIGFSQ